MNCTAAKPGPSCGMKPGTSWLSRISTSPSTAGTGMRPLVLSSGFRTLNSEPKYRGSMTNQPVKSVAVVGAGTIGASWAVCFTTHGLEARLYDEAPGALDRAEALMAESLAVLA